MTAIEHQIERTAFWITSIEMLGMEIGCGPTVGCCIGCEQSRETSGQSSDGRNTKCDKLSAMTFLSDRSALDFLLPPLVYTSSYLHNALRSSQQPPSELCRLPPGWCSHANRSYIHLYPWPGLLTKLLLPSDPTPYRVPPLHHTRYIWRCPLRIHR